MKPVIRNILAVIIGWVVGGMVNMSFIMMSGRVIPPPAGADVTTTEGLKASMHLFEPKHFLFPFLAHALGTLAGATVASAIAASHQFKLAMLIGVLFMAGGIASVMMLPSPMWFSVVDIVGAYLPMAWIGWKLGARKKTRLG
jgi:hypothetical protein